ncbi:uncharacterized protein LOC135493581 [Lineus longissimus]|uniref:uncharacterized protein LOC135493581 n=1 Tax=Lineus longissimus TaxID=88925 RepID=UPI00315D6A35
MAASPPAAEARGYVQGEHVMLFLGENEEPVVAHKDSITRMERDILRTHLRRRMAALKLQIETETEKLDRHIRARDREPSPSLTREPRPNIIREHSPEIQQTYDSPRRPTPMPSPRSRPVPAPRRSLARRNNVNDQLSPVLETPRMQLQYEDCLPPVNRAVPDSDNRDQLGGVGLNVNSSQFIPVATSHEREAAKEYAVTAGFTEDLCSSMECLVSTLKTACDIAISPTNGTHDSQSDRDKKSTSVSSDHSEVQPLIKLIDAVQLPKVELVTFSGDPLRYWTFIRSFDSAVGNKPSISDDTKLMQLLQYCRGNARQVIECCTMMDSSQGYVRARAILKERFGNEFVITKAWLDRVSLGKAIRAADSGGLQVFADDLNSCLEVFVSMNKVSEIDTMRSIRVMSERLPLHLQNRWRRKAVETARVTGNYPNIAEFVKFVSLAATEANDPLFGTPGHYNDSTAKEHSNAKEHSHRKTEKTSGRTLVTQNADDSRGASQRICQMCKSEDHAIWHCTAFKEKNIPDRWQVAKDRKLCFRCLSSFHLGENCPRSSKCGIGGCTDSHNRLLHRSEGRQERGAQQKKKAGNSKEKDAQKQVEKTDHPGSSHCITMATGHRQPVALRTVPVILKSKGQRLKVNALLDDASTSSYINSGVAEELGFRGQISEARVNVLNGSTKTFMTMPVEIGLESLDRKVDIVFNARTVDNITGDLRHEDWNVHSSQYTHLKNIVFPKAGRRCTVDVLIGADYPELHLAYQEIIGKPGEPVARKTGLGWTCIGPIPNANGSSDSTNFAHSYFSHTTSFSEMISPDIDNTLRRFWEVESVVHSKQVMSPEESQVFTKTKESLKVVEDRYQIDVPWKGDQAPSMPGSREMAEKRLVSTERKLLKDKEIAQSYQNVITQYLEKGYVKKIPDGEDRTAEENTWYLPHFAVVRPDKATTKTRIVFDASAKSNGTSLNDKIHQGPKLQLELFDVLLRFRQKPIALVCDISQMYLQISVNPSQRSYFRFIWRDLDQSRKQEIYEF